MYATSPYAASTTRYGAGLNVDRGYIGCASGNGASGSLGKLALGFSSFVFSFSGTSGSFGRWVFFFSDSITLFKSSPSTTQFDVLVPKVHPIQNSSRSLFFLCFFRRALTCGVEFVY